MHFEISQARMTRSSGLRGAGAKAAELYRKHGISSATFYKWKAKYGGLELTDARPSPQTRFWLPSNASAKPTRLYVANFRFT